MHTSFSNGSLAFQGRCLALLSSLILLSLTSPAQGQAKGKNRTPPSAAQQQAASAQNTVVKQAQARALSPAIPALPPGKIEVESLETKAAAVLQQAYFYVKEYRIKGSKHHILSEREIGEAVYPFLGPYRTPTDVENARSALEKTFQEKGYQTVTVTIPVQTVKRGIVSLQVNEFTIGRVRVLGSRYYDLDQIKEQTAHLAPGTVPNFNLLSRDVLALNQLPDRTVSPSVKTGLEPGTIDINFQVKDHFPFHGSLEVNNRNSPNTTSLRLNTTLSYDNLWQMGHSLSGSFQVAPEDPRQVLVYTGTYIARIPEVPNLSLMAYGVVSDSNVASLGNVSVSGKGQVIGSRLTLSLPQLDSYYHSVSGGVDFKSFNNAVSVVGIETPTVYSYFPLVANYTGTWVNKDGSNTNMNLGLNLGLPMGSTDTAIDQVRYKAERNFFYLKGDLSHTQILPEKFELYTKMQTQIAAQPLVNTEEFGAGGLDTVRGYFESEQLGDNAAQGTIEFRSPPLGQFIGTALTNWRVYGFADGAYLTINDPLVGQDAYSYLASVGVGTQVQLFEHFNASIDLAEPLLETSDTNPDGPKATFRIYGNF